MTQQKDWPAFPGRSQPVPIFISILLCVFFAGLLGAIVVYGAE